MPHGADCCALLQTESLVVPTQWVLVDTTPTGQVADWLPPAASPELDLLRAPRPAPHADLKAALVAARPALTAGLLDALERRRAETAGRLVLTVVGDLADPVSRAWLRELPLDLANLAFWSAGVAPGVLRLAWGGDATTRAAWLASVAPQYFALPDFSAPWEGEHRPGQLYGNAFDAVVLADEPAPLAALIERLAGLHREESAAARRAPASERAGGVLVLEEVIAASRAWRRIDWLALALYPLFPRLWRLPADDLLGRLDMTQADPADPWAGWTGAREREPNWKALALPPGDWDELEGEEPYRITPGDARARLVLAEFLRQVGSLEEAKAHCLIGASEVASGFEPRWLRVEGLVRLGLGETERGGELIASYRDGLLADPHLGPAALDEVATMFLVTGDHAAARAHARRALALDPRLLHALDTLTLAGRAAGQPAWEDEARDHAARHTLRVPLLVREATERAARASQGAAEAEGAAEGGA